MRRSRSTSTSAGEVTVPLTVAELNRWELFGATWRVVEMTDDHVVIDLCTCTNELVQRRESDDRALVQHVRSHTRGTACERPVDGT
jgi:hypothetical protein